MVVALVGRMLSDEPAAPSPEPEGSDIVEVYSFSTGLMVLLMILWSSFGHQVARRTKYVGEGSAACALGLITGLGILITQRYFTEEVIHQLLTFNPADFFTYFLPPIIFYAGLSVKKKQFFRNFVSIAAFGILGTYIAFAVIAFVLYGFSKLPNILTLQDCLALGVIFAATDSVAVLQVLKQDKMPLLYSLVFGEGVINDATSVALLRAVQALSGAEVGSLSPSTVTDILIKFMYLFVASLILGLAFGLGTSWLMKAFKSNSTPQEVALVGLLGYLSYLTGELVGLSGIVTLFCCAVAISHYALHNVSSMSRVTIVSAFQTLSYMSEGAIFIYVGMDMLDPIKWKNTKPGELAWLFCVLLLLMVLGRAAFVFPLSFVHNWWAKEHLTVKEMVVIWWSGLIRGAVSVALVYYYFDPAGKSEDSHRATLITTTLMEVMTSIFVFGAATKPLLDYLLGPHVMQPEGSISMELMAGRKRSSTFSRSYEEAPLYAVVSMEPDDEVANHVDIPERLLGKRRGGSSSSSFQGSLDDGSDHNGSERLLGSHGQNLSELAENMPPAMAVQEQQSPRSRSRLRQKWGYADQMAAENREPSIAFGKDAGEFGDRSSEEFGGRQSDGEPSRVQEGRHRSGRSRWGAAAGQADDADRDPWQSSDSMPMASPFENEQRDWRARREDEAVTDATNMVARTESLPNSRIHNWWTTFDARYMQPVFGAPVQPTPASVELHRRTSNSTAGQDDRG